IEIRGLGTTETTSRTLQDVRPILLEAQYMGRCTSTRRAYARDARSARRCRLRRGCFQQGAFYERWRSERAHYCTCPEPRQINGRLAWPKRLKDDESLQYPPEGNCNAQY